MNIFNQSISLMSYFLSKYLIILLSVIAVFFILLFIYFYIIKAIKINRKLNNFIKAIKGIGPIGEPEARGAMDQIFKNSSFDHVWHEYQETLHDQRYIDGTEEKIKKTRSTVPAHIFFNHQIIIETPLAVEFYKHLPGILTGMGIIGTFFGLVTGLSEFNISDPQKINDSLTLLLSNVKGAFIFSGIAISFAIIITVLEKYFFEKITHLLDQLNQLIDKQFDAGVGEEYLSDLVLHSKESSTQTKQLKDSLVNDLKAMLKNLLDEQANQNRHLAESLSTSYKEASEYTATKISESVENSLKAPLDKIADSVNAASGDQTTRVQSLLEDVLVAFTEKLESIFGRQFDGLHEMMGKSVTAISEMQTGFGQLIQEMKESSLSSSNAIQEKLNETMQDMNRGQIEMQSIMSTMIKELHKTIADISTQGESVSTKMGDQLARLFDESEVRQQKLAQHMESFINTIKENVDKGQQESMGQLFDSIGQLESKFESIFESFKTSRGQMDEASLASQKLMQTQTSEVMNSVGEQMKSLLSTLEHERIVTREIIDSIGEHTKNSLSQMNLGADKMDAAAEKFTSAGESLSDVAFEVEEVMEKVHASTKEMSGGLIHLSKIIDDYKLLRDSVQKTFTTIESVVSSAQIDANTRKQMNDELKIVIKEMKNNTQEATQYFEGINKVLAQSFNQFGEGVDTSLTKIIGTLDKNLSSVVTQMSDNFSELGENVEALNDVFEKSLSKTQ